MLVVGMQAVTANLHSITHWGDVLGSLSNQIPVDWLVLAQQASNPDVLNRMQAAWNNFVQTGQLWALLIGLVIGYVFRSFTSF